MAIAALITLHQPDGRPIYVNPEEIIIVSPPDPEFGPRKFKASILIHDAWIHVLETPTEVKRLRDGE
jgi:hypothetical protein